MKRALVVSRIAAAALLAACSDGSVARRTGPAGDGGELIDAVAEGVADVDGIADGGDSTETAPGQVSSEGAAGDASDADADSPVPMCSPDAVALVAVGTVTGGQPFDPLGYAPYAIAGCTLVYVAPPAAGQASGELRLNRLATGDDTPLAPASDQPRRPSITGDLIAWEAIIAGKSSVRVSKGGATNTVRGPFDHAGEPRVTSDAVVFTAWLSSDDAGDTDVYLYSPDSQQLVALATGAGQQRFADVSEAFVAVTDFSEDPTGAFDPATHRDADIVVFDRSTLAKTVRHLPGKQAFPMLGSSSRLGYLDWGAITPEPKFSAYTIRVGAVASNPALDANVKGAQQVTVRTPYVRPSLRGDWLEWVDDSIGNGGLFRSPIDLSQAVTSTLSGRSLLGPAAGSPLTVVATPGNGFVLLGIAR